jgi:hypothetical protein
MSESCGVRGLFPHKTTETSKTPKSLVQCFHSFQCFGCYVEEERTAGHVLCRDERNEKIVEKQGA